MICFAFDFAMLSPCQYSTLWASAFPFFRPWMELTMVLFARLPVEPCRFSVMKLIRKLIFVGNVEACTATRLHERACGIFSLGSLKSYIKLLAFHFLWGPIILINNGRGFGSVPLSRPLSSRISHTLKQLCR